jgi:hypothetical protein
MKISTIKTELDLTNERLSELITMRDGINTNLQTLQARFINGKIPLGEMEVEQARLNTLDTSIQSLETKRTELQTAFDELTATETRAALIETTRAAANESEKLWNQALNDRRELDDAIGNSAEKFVDKMVEFHAKRKSYLNLRGQLEPTTKIPEISDDAILLLEKNHLNFPPIRFGLSVQSACEVVEKEREKSELAERQAEKARQMSSGRY